MEQPSSSKNGGEKRTRNKCKQAVTVGEVQNSTTMMRRRQKNKSEPIPFKSPFDYDCCNDHVILEIFSGVVQKSKAFCNGTSNELPIGSLTHSITLVASICSTIDKDYKNRVMRNNDRQQRYFPYGARLIDSVETVVALLGGSLKVRKYPQERRREWLEMNLRDMSAPHIVLILFDVHSIRDHDSKEAFYMMYSWARDPAYRVGLIVTFNNETDSTETFPDFSLVMGVGAIPFLAQFEHDEFASADHMRLPQQPQTGQPDTTKDLNVSSEEETFSQRDLAEGSALANNAVARKEKLARIAETFLSTTPLTPTEQSIVNEYVYGNGKKTDILRMLGCVSRVSVTRESMHRLKPGVWLNDEIINFFFRILQKHDEELSFDEPERSRSYFFISYLYEKIFFNEAGEYNYDEMKRWSRSMKINIKRNHKLPNLCGRVYRYQHIPGKQVHCYHAWKPGEERVHAPPQGRDGMTVFQAF
jgi:hypothetical protein